MTRRVARAGLALGVTALLVVVPAAVAQAHPLGNFTVNHYRGLTLTPEAVSVLAVVDMAEIPTQQELPNLDSDGDDATSPAELTSYAGDACADLAAASTLTVNGAAVALVLDAAEAGTVPGAANLPTLRLTCTLSADVDLSEPASLSFEDTYRGDRVGWHELTAVGAGVRLVESAVPNATVSDELRAYPEDLLSSPLDDRWVALRTEPGEGASVSGPGTTGRSQDPFSRLVAAGDRMLQDSLRDEFTPLVGGLAVLLALLLGAGHALLPGHGKTVMAAYLAGRRGSRRDAYKVGAIVTFTHTASVLVLGLIISVSATFVGEQALRYLGVVSGLLIALVGGLLLRDALSTRRARTASAVSTLVAAGSAEQGHAHAGTDEARHADHERQHALGVAHDHVADPAHAHDHSHEHSHNHAHDHSHEHEESSDREHSHGLSGWLGHGHSHDVAGGHSHGPTDRPGGRFGLIGMGVAGGLIPSPSALIVLIGAIGLGRTVFGVLLVLLYGVGMAATLTAVGLLLVRMRGRLDRVVASGQRRLVFSRVAAALPVITAVLVLVVGLGLAARGVVSPV